MNAIEFIQGAIDDLNTSIIDDVKTLAREQLTWKPAPNANPIAFLFWHIMRTEDERVHGMQGKPSIWESENLHQKLGLDPKATGTGLREPDVDSVSKIPLSELLAYADKVIKYTKEYLNSLDEAKLDLAPDPNRPTMTNATMIRRVLLSHGWWHLGEIRYLKGLQGMPFAR